MARIKLTKAYDVRRYEEHFLDTNDLTPEQRELLDADVILSDTGYDDERVEEIIGNMSDPEPSYADSEKPEVVYVILPEG